MKKLVPIAVVVIVLIGGAAYYFVTKNGSTTDNKNTTSRTSSMDNMPKNSEDSSSSKSQATDKVSIDNFAFNPASITVKKGTTVTWTNMDTAAHTVTETDSQDGPKSDNLAKGASYTFTFNTAGTFKYHCAIHPSMTGTVTVTE